MTVKIIYTTMMPYIKLECRIEMKITYDVQISVLHEFKFVIRPCMLCNLSARQLVDEACEIGESES